MIFMELNSKTIKKILFIIFCGAVIFTAIQKLPSVWAGFSVVISLFNPIIAALCIAFVLNVLLRALETKVFAFMGNSNKKFVNKLRRPICLVLTYLIAFGLVSLLILVIIPDIIETITYIAEKLPSFVTKSYNRLGELLERFKIDKEILPEIKINWNSIFETAKSLVSNYYNKIFDGAIGITTSVVGGVYNTIFSFVISVYILAQKERIGRFVKRVIDAFIPENQTKIIYHIALRTEEAFSRFIGGQLIEAIILGALCFVCMIIFRLPNALIISVLISVTALVPVIGSTVGVIIGFLLIVITNPLKAILFVLFILVLQQVEGNLIYPKVVGRAVGLPGVIVVCAVLLGGNIGGIVGALIAVPTAAVVYTLLKEAVEIANEKKKINFSKK